jgi:hypothetical protein
MLPLYEKVLLVSQTAPTIFQSTEIYWDLDDYFDEVIEMQGTWELVDPQIQKQDERHWRTTPEKWTPRL